MKEGGRVSFGSPVHTHLGWKIIMEGDMILLRSAAFVSSFLHCMFSAQVMTKMMPKALKRALWFPWLHLTANACMTILQKTAGTPVGACDLITAGSSNVRTLPSGSATSLVYAASPRTVPCKFPLPLSPTLQ